MDTKENIIRVAEAIILKKGFNAFSYNNISEKSDLHSALIHEHFPTKDDLGKAVIQKARLDFREWSKHIDYSNLKPVEKLDAFFGSYQTLLADGNKICIAGILGAELNSLSEKILNELRCYFLERQKWLQQLLVDGLSNCSFFFNTTLEEESIYILSSLQGGLQIARTNEDYDIFFTICRQLKYHLLKSKKQ